MNKYIEALKITLFEFIKDLGDGVFTEDHERGDLKIVEFYFKRIPDNILIEKITQNVLPHEKKIRERDEFFFIKNEHIFAGLPKDRIRHFGELWEIPNPKLTDENKNIIWNYFDTIIAITNAYNKNK